MNVSRVVVSLALWLFIQAARGEEAVAPASGAPAASVLQQEIEQLNQSNRVLEEVIRNLIRRIEVLEDSAQGRPASGEIGERGDDRPIDPEARARMEKESEANYQLIQSAFEQRLTQEGGMLLGPKQFIYELNFSYSHASYDKIVVDGFSIFPVLVVGDIVSEQVRRDTIINNHSFRLGVGRDNQLDLVIPVGYEREQSFRADGTHDSKNSTGIGDISLALSHQLVRSDEFWPDTVIGLSWKSATGKDPYGLIGADELALGSGFINWGLSLTSMTTADPIVMFGGISANYTRADQKDIGYVEPGESYGLNLGMALALNFDTSLSFHFQYRLTKETDIDRLEISGTELTTSTFAIGLSKASGDLGAVDVDLGIGLTRDSPDFQLSVSFPFKFLKD